jgi:hypothetical protein
MVGKGIEGEVSKEIFHGSKVVNFTPLPRRFLASNASIAFTTQKKTKMRQKVIT